MGPWVAPLFFVLLTACAAGGFNSVQKTVQLRPGRTLAEAVALLDPPKEAARGDGRSRSAPSGSIHVAYANNNTAHRQDPQLNGPGGRSFEGNPRCRKSAHGR